MKISKKLLFIFLTLIMLLGFGLNYSFADSSDLSLEEVNYNININSDGSMNVEEIWDIYIEETNTLFKEFALDKTKYTDIVNGSVSIVNNLGQEQMLFDSNTYEYHVPTGEYYFLNLGSSYEVAWGTGLENSSARRKYIIRYTVVDAIAKYNDVAELYWQVFGRDFEIPIKKLTGTITLPNDAENLEDIKVWGHSEALNGVINVKTKNQVSFEVDKNNSGNMIEVRVAFPSNIIETSGRTYNANKLASIIEEETKWADDANAKRTSRYALLGIFFLIVTIVLIYVLIRNLKVINNTVKLHPTQKLDYFRELPRKDSTPLEARFIIDNSYNNINRNIIGEIFTATMLNLSIKKAIKIESESGSKSDKDSKIIILAGDITSITKDQDEIEVFNIIKDAANNYARESYNEITLKDLKKYIRAHEIEIKRLALSFDRIAKSKLITKKILSPEGIKKKNSLKFNAIIYAALPIGFYMFLAFSSQIINIISQSKIFGYLALFVVALFILDIIMSIKANNKIDAYTQEGIDEQEKWKAFKKYMEDFSLLNEKEIPDIAIWEQFLVYATAFGIAEKVIKQLKIVYPQYMDNNNFANNYATMYLLMHTDFSRSFGTIGSTMNTSFSSGSGGGGGFSGGGGGGGRWPEVAADAKQIIKKEKEKMENDINYMENKNIPTQQHKIKSENWIVGITIAALLISLLGKLLTTGLTTFFLCLFMIVPAQFVIFTAAGLYFARVKDKKIIDYIIYALMCITMIMYAYFFVDSGELGDKITVFSWAQKETLSTFSEISTNSYAISLILTIILVIRCGIKGVKDRKNNNDIIENNKQLIINKEEKVDEIKVDNIKIDDVQENYKVPIILKIICFLIPIVGLIIGIYYEKRNKKLSKACLISAAIGFISLIAIMKFMDLITLINIWTLKY